MVMARYNEILFKDMEETEKYYSMLYEKDKENGSGPYSMFLMRQNRWKTAEEVSRNLLPKDTNQVLFLRSTHVPDRNPDP